MQQSYRNKIEIRDFIVFRYCSHFSRNIIYYDMRLKMLELCILFTSMFIYIIGAPQNPEINDQYENKTTTAAAPTLTNNDVTTIRQEIKEVINNNENVYDESRKWQFFGSRKPNFTKEIIFEPDQTFNMRWYTTITLPIKKFVMIPKINIVLRNIGTCIVNGAMEIISYYFPSPLIPLIASAAGMLIPFEPVVTLKERMPVTSYRRAIKTAVDGFVNSFDKFKVDVSDEDPYMTRRFNRRFMNDDKKTNAEERFVNDNIKKVEAEEQ